MATILYVLAAIAASWISMLSSVLIGGLPLLILAVLLAALKLAGVVAWSWWWVVLPIWVIGGSVLGKLWIVTRDPMWRLRAGMWR
jgi:hypothetical protein